MNIKIFYLLLSHSTLMPGNYKSLAPIKPLERLLNLKHEYELAKKHIEHKTRLTKERYERQKSYKYAIDQRNYQQSIDKLLHENKKIDLSLKELESLEKNIGNTSPQIIEQSLQNLAIKKDNLLKDINNIWEYHPTRVFNLHVKSIDNKDKKNYEDLLDQSHYETFEQYMSRLKKLIIVGLSIMALAHLYIQKLNESSPQFGWLNNILEPLQKQLQSDEELIKSFDYAAHDFTQAINQNTTTPQSLKLSENINELDRYYKRIWEEIQKYSQADLNKLNLFDLQVSKNHINTMPNSLQKLIS